MLPVQRTFPPLAAPIKKATSGVLAPALAKAGHEMAESCETCHILQSRSSCRVRRRLSRHMGVGWPSTCSARSVSFNRTVRDVESCTDITSHDALVQRHFRSTLPYWQQIYRDQSVYGRIYQERARRAIACVDRLALTAGTSVLEIGCGPGIITTAIARRGVNVSAIDSLHEMVERTMAMAEREGLAARVSARVGQIDDVPFADA